MITDGVRELLERLAHAWSTQDTELGLSRFTQSAVYVEPPDVQLFVGHEQLRPYFAALTPGTFMRFHTLAFDESVQRGACESRSGAKARGRRITESPSSKIEAGLIRVWREYVRKGPASFEEFTATEGKTWQWHIGKYP